MRSIGGYNGTWNGLVAVILVTVPLLVTAAAASNGSVEDRLLAELDRTMATPRSATLQGRMLPAPLP